VSDRRYLGDGVYVKHDNYGLILTAKSGTHSIYLGAEVWRELMRFAEEIKKNESA